MSARFTIRPHQFPRQRGDDAAVLRFLKEHCLPSSQVPADERDLAETTARVAARELLLPSIPDIYWYGAELAEATNCIGLTWFSERGGTIPPIAILAGLDTEQLVRTVGHELRHVWQSWTSAYLHPSDCENDAKAFELAFINRLLREP